MSLKHILGRFQSQNQSGKQTQFQLRTRVQPRPPTAPQDQTQSQSTPNLREQAVLNRQRRIDRQISAVEREQRRLVGAKNVTDDPMQSSLEARRSFNESRIDRLRSERSKFATNSSNTSRTTSSTTSNTPTFRMQTTRRK